MLSTTALSSVHRELGAKMVDFSGWEMPLHYGSQVEEHMAVRQEAGMFDVSHMTIVDVTGDSAKAFLRYLLANDVAKLEQVGHALYTAMLKPQGGVLDDLIVYRMEQGYRLVVNCATREKDLNWMRQQAAKFEVDLHERPQLAIIAIQGPEARQKFHKLLQEADVKSVQSLSNFNGAYLTGHSQSFVARTGYTGEDGYEVILPNDQAEQLWRSLLDEGVRPCGLGARDSLRLEAGYNLYGHEMDEDISPLVANMAWTVDFSGEREFIGRSSLELEKETGIKDKLVGLVMQSRGMMREGFTVYSSDSARTGTVTSGSFSPVLGCSIALARVPVNIGLLAEVELRGKRVQVDVVRPCFVRYGEPVA